MTNLPGNFSWVDLVILLIVGAGVLVGYTQGLLRQIVGLGALYLSTILATQNFIGLSSWINNLFKLPSSRFVNVISFLFILLAIAALINLLAADAYRMTKLKIAPTLDQVGGSFLGLVTIMILLIFLIPILRFVTGEPFPYFETARTGIIQGMETSRIVPLILYYRPLVLGTISPWVPGGLPALFDL